MKEEIIVSGRMNPLIDPELHIWEWPIPLYLFLGGLAAGILVFASFYILQGKEDKFRTAVKVAPLITPILLIIGLLALIYDLNHRLYFWQLFTTLRLTSPMSWGAWTLLVVTPLSVVLGAIYLKDVFPGFNWKVDWLEKPIEFFKKNRKILAWILIILSLILGVYTGILLSAFNARPLWNTSILGPLFLTSGLSTGAAAIVLMSKSHEERLHFAKLDLVFIGIELFLIVHMFMGFMASTEVQIQAAGLFLGGPYTTPFWLFVVFMGLILPAILEVLEIKGYRLPLIIAPILVLIGGLLFRFIIAYAGQASRWLY
ncbi:MAG TPA: polysulfide reductase NrfD [Bacteroidales bacterium]|nr:polysulfide reductase NrfD [Bacteroidales bacterium]